jgi:LmbE family N-acetylglucosaminyl deacetylase
MLRLSVDPAAPLHILALGAHSDDIEIGCGGALLALLAARPNARVSWVVFGAAGERAEEARASAARFLGSGAARVQVYAHRDGFFPAEFAAIKERFEALKALPAPDLVFTHYRDDRHQDHRALSDLAWNTWRGHTILEYEIPKYDGDLGAPNLFVPLADEVAERKVALLMEGFATQRSKRWFTEDTFYGLMRLRGIECPTPTRYAEAFYARKLALLG